jgi:hypothetical protein
VIVAMVLTKCHEQIGDRSLGGIQVDVGTTSDQA